MLDIEEKTIYIQIKNEIAEVNGKQVVLPIYPFVVQDRGGHTMIACRFLAEALGARVEWDAHRKAIKIQL